MLPLFFSLSNNVPLMIIPDTQAHLDGHTVLTYTYSIFRDDGKDESSQNMSKEALLHLKSISDPSYLGFIIFEKPGQLFTYTANGKRQLNPAEVEKIIEQISYIRDNPDTWKHLHDL